MEQLVQEYYQQYKLFINNKDLPPINPVLNVNEKTIEDTLAFVDTDDLHKPVVDIHIDKKLFEYKQQYYKSVLFHEFTHIHDGAILFGNIDDENTLVKLMSTYSEYHASQIELLCNLGYKTSFNIFKTFRMSSNVCHEDEFVDVEKYLLKPLVSALSILKKDENAYMNLDDTEYNTNVVIAEKCIMYYLGKYNVCEKFADKKPHNFFKEFGDFQEDVLLIYKYLKNKNYDEIIEMEDRFEKHFLNYFKFKL